MDRDDLSEPESEKLGAARRGRPAACLAALAAFLLAAWVAACAPAVPTAPPGPVGTPEPARPDAGPAAEEAVPHLDPSHGERLGWGGIWVGSSRQQVEESLGRELPDLEEVEPDLLCDRRTVGVSHLGRPLDLEFEGTGEDARLAAISLRLGAGERSRAEVVRALKTRFDGLEYLPSPHAPGVPEEENPKPVYRIPGDGRIFLNLPELYFGEICVD